MFEYYLTFQRCTANTEVIDMILLWCIFIAFCKVQLSCKYVVKCLIKKLQTILKLRIKNNIT